MNALLHLSLADRRLACLQTEENMGLLAASVEKDFWVCWTLREISLLPDIGRHITFKGGTSLSKVWVLIERFSEDIDLIVDKEVLGFGGDASPDSAPSKNQKERRLHGLMDACRHWVQETLRPALAASLGHHLGAGGWKLEIDPDMADGQCLLFHYPGAFAPNELGYVRPVVKIEMGARSDDWPATRAPLQPYLAALSPQLAVGATFEVRTLAAERTFWEKAMLLHEETFRPMNQKTKPRMARHYYDLWCLMERGIAGRATADKALFDRVAAHREIYFRHTWVDYTTLRPGTLTLLPPEDRLKEWRDDYQAMKATMFFNEVPEFDEILIAVGAFERSFNAIPRSGVD